jgi:hypothetical protein
MKKITKKVWIPAVCHISCRIHHLSYVTDNPLQIFFRFLQAKYDKLCLFNILLSINGLGTNKIYTSDNNRTRIFEEILSII